MKTLVLRLLPSLRLVRLLCPMLGLVCLGLRSPMVAAAAEGFQAGLAKVRITPPTPFWMSGYAARTHPSDGVRQELWAKALALQDDTGGRVVCVTADLIGLPRDLTDVVAEQAKMRHGLERSQILFNASHTHGGPMVGNNLSVLFDFNAEEAARVAEYSRKLTEQLGAIIDEALHDLAPARLAAGHGKVGFGTNRRQATTDGYRIGVNPAGPVDHDVPVLRVTSPDGTLRAVLFGYACHNTTLGGDCYQIHGDYAGYAQAAFEREHPEAIAQFLMLCGADQNPGPRGSVALVTQHGEALAAEVRRVLTTSLREVKPPIRTAYQILPLEFAPHTRQTFVDEARSADRYRQRRARLMLAAYDAGQPVRETPFPVQAVRLGDDLTFLALGGEVVVDYALRSKREYPQENLIVAGYCHDVMGYLPSRRVLLEGGYEAVDSMIYYGQPGPFTPGVEEAVFAGIHAVLRQTGARRGAY